MKQREIKFRGKNYKNEWKFGFYFEYAEEGELTKGHVVPSKYSAQPIEEFIIDCETLGQFTGVKLRDKTELWEGDICDAVICGVECIVKIVFENGCFGIKNDIGDFYNFEVSLIDVKKVIGNIYENPELLAT